jgi:CMP-N,N'-diacetyllegionaminic acid synthase
MKLLALIPARGGSKRIPNKNIRVLGSKPLITWSIDAARAVPELADVLVSTDSPLIAQIARDAGAMVPWLRPAALASDTASSSDVLKHALEWYELERSPVDGVVLLQPTCPFRRATSLLGALQRFRDQPAGDDRSTVVSVSPSAVPPEWCFRMDATNGELLPLLGWSELGKRSQDLQSAVQLNGSIYIASSATIRAGQPLVGPGSIAFFMPGAEESVDIDTEDDWRLAESFLGR